MNQFIWPHKDLLDVDDLSLEEISYLLDSAEQFQEVNSRPIKKVPTLRGKGIVLFFAEDSTRTKTSFDIAGKRLSADTFALGKSGSSMNKGESLKDTALTLEAMNPDILVIRHSANGAAHFLAERLTRCSVVNAGDGRHAHPTQALLDAYTLRRQWQGKMQGKTVLIVGDILHSRVARSNIKLLSALGVKVRLFAPRTLMPLHIAHWPAEEAHDLNEGLAGTDAVICLRLQLERQTSGLLPDLAEYAARFCITSKSLSLAAPGAVVLHPGPINRGLEISAELADSPHSRILDQVNAGVAVRMAVLLTLGSRNDALAAACGQ
ncbi:MAG: aspartate carbamoyltransferase catalytic subunit [Deltaproteobacteria bacterium]|jgi:aspartate carbamoyltransferase catalytic subunit|nr:aspartate carbamoyltransferase catalytic subunit [Deltaproteobacteria bacterium]